VLLLLCTALCVRFLFRRPDQLPGRVRHVFASPATAITHPTAALATTIDAPNHFVPVPSELWLDVASGLVTAAITPTLAATFAYATSTRLAAILAASMVATHGAPVHRAALH
jgi:hypothetical protein